MKKLTVFQLSLLLMLLISQLSFAESKLVIQPADIISIYDADTFRVNIKDWPPLIGRSIPIRIMGFDAPEIRGRCDYERQAALLARQLTVDLLAQAKVIELRHLKRGKYFRLLSDVWVDDQRLADTLISSGLARPYNGGQRQGWCHEFP
ncbi:MAG: thermonuclease family protein [Candidatus Thiodiazotropha taylori]